MYRLNPGRDAWQFHIPLYAVVELLQVRIADVGGKLIDQRALFGVGPGNPLGGRRIIKKKSGTVVDVEQILDGVCDRGNSILDRGIVLPNQEQLAIAARPPLFTASIGYQQPFLFVYVSPRSVELLDVPILIVNKLEERAGQLVAHPLGLSPLSQLLSRTAHMTSREGVGEEVIRKAVRKRRATKQHRPSISIGCLGCLLREVEGRGMPGGISDGIVPSVVDGVLETQLDEALGVPPKRDVLVGIGCLPLLSGQIDPVDLASQGPAQVTEVVLLVEPGEQRRLLIEKIVRRFIEVAREGYNLSVGELLGSESSLKGTKACHWQTAILAGLDGRRSSSVAEPQVLASFKLVWVAANSLLNLEELIQRVVGTHRGLREDCSTEAAQCSASRHALNNQFRYVCPLTYSPYVSSFKYVQQALRRPTDFIFGFDFFISYAQSDGLGYPERLAETLTGLGYKVCLDRRQYHAGEDIHLLTRRYVRNSNTLIIIGRPGVLRSVWVLREVEQCLDAGRTPLVIDINQTVLKAPDANQLKALLHDRLYIPEALAEPDGVPSLAVIQELQKRFVGVRQEHFRFRLLVGTTVTFAVLAGVATWQWRTAVHRRNQAAQRLVSQRVSNGTRAVIDGDLFGAWSWYANALSLSRESGIDERAHRERLYSLRQQLPQLRQLLYKPEVTRAAVAPDAQLIAVYLKSRWSQTKTPEVGRIGLVSVRDGTRTAELVVGDSYLQDMVFSPRGDELWTVRSDVDAASKQRRLTISSHSVSDAVLKKSLTLDEQHAQLRWFDRTTLLVIDYRAAHVVRFSPGTIEVETLSGPPQTSGEDASTYVLAIAKDARLLAFYRYSDHKLIIRREEPQREAYALDFAHSPTVVFSPDGQFLITVEIRKLVFWKLQATAEKIAETELVGFANRLLFLREGGLLITEERDRASLVSTLWSVESGSLRKTFEHDKVVTRWEFPVENQSGSASGTAVGMKLVSPFVPFAIVSEDGARLITVSKRQQSYRVWDIETGEALTPPLAHGGAELRSLSFSSDGRNVLSTADDGLTMLWDVALPRRFKPLLGQPGVVKHLSFIGSQQRLLSLSGKRAQLCDWYEGKEVAVLDEELDALEVVAAGSAIAGRQRDRFRLFSAENFAPMSGWLAHPKLDGLGVSEKGRYAASWSEEYEQPTLVRLWDLHAGTMLAELSPVSNWLNAVAIDERQGFAIFVGRMKEGGGHELLVHDFATKTQTKSRTFQQFRFEGIFRSTPAASLIVFDGQNFWPLGRNGEKAARPYGSNQSALSRFLAASPDGTQVVLTDQDQQIAQVVNVRTGAPLTPEFRHEWRITSAQIVPDGQRLLTLSGNRVHIWDLGSGEAVVPVVRYPDTVTAAALHPQAQAFVASSKQKVGDESVGLFIHRLAAETATVAGLIAYGEVSDRHRIDTVGARLPLPPSQRAALWQSISNADRAALAPAGSELAWLRQMEAESTRETLLYYLDQILDRDPTDQRARMKRADRYGMRGDHAAFLSELEMLWRLAAPHQPLPIASQRARRWSEWLLGSDRPGEALRVLSGLGQPTDGYNGRLLALASFGAGDLATHRRNAEFLLHSASRLAEVEGPWEEKWNAAYHAAESCLLSDETAVQLRAAVALLVPNAREPRLSKSLQILQGAAALRSGDLARAESQLHGLEDYMLAKALMANVQLRKGNLAQAWSVAAELHAALDRRNKSTIRDVMLETELRYLLQPIDSAASGLTSDRPD